MLTEQLLWMVGGGTVIAAIAFMIHILRMPRRGLSDVSSADSGRTTTQAAHSRRIRTKGDAIAFFRQETRDEELALLLADAIETNGRDGYVEVRQGESASHTRSNTPIAQKRRWQPIAERSRKSGSKSTRLGQP